MLNRQSIQRIQNGVVVAAYANKESTMSEEDKVRNLRHDILNAAKHVFGDHSKCRLVGIFYHE